jgi:hypothetical protein
MKYDGQFKNVPKDYNTFSGVIPINGLQVALYNVPGFAAARRIIVIGDGITSIADLVAQLVVGVQEAQIVTLSTEDVSAGMWAPIFSITLNAQGAESSMRISMAAVGMDAAPPDFTDVMFRVKQVAALNNAPVVSAEQMIVTGDGLRYDFKYVVALSALETVVTVYAQVNTAFTSLNGFVLSAVNPSAVQYLKNVEYETEPTGTNFLVKGFITSIDGISGTDISLSSAYEPKATNINHDYATGWTAYPAATYTFPAGTKAYGAGVCPIGAVTTNPTKGTTSYDKAWWKKESGDMLIKMDYVQTAGGVAGSGVYLFAMPYGYTIDTSVYPVNSCIGYALSNNSTDIYETDTASEDGHIYVYSSTLVYIKYTAPGAATGVPVSNAAYPLSYARLKYRFEARVKCAQFTTYGYA